MRKIFKFPIEIVDEQVVMIPFGSQILCVQTQFEIPCLWALCDPGASAECRYIIIHGTGHAVEYPNSKKYIGTFQVDGGNLVFHVFEKLKKVPV